MKGDKKIFEEIVSRFDENYKSSYPQTQQFQHKKHKKNDTKHIIIKLLKITGKEKILKATR